MSNELLQVIEQIGREKGIDPDLIITAVQEAIVTASRKYFKSNEDFVSRFNRETGKLEVFARKTVVENVTNPGLEISLEEAQKVNPDAAIGSEVEIPKPTSDLSRIAAQAAKQVIFQKVRDAEREMIYQEYIKKKNELTYGIVKRIEHGDIIIDLGKTEAVLPYNQQSRTESYSQGDRIRVVILDATRSAKGPQVIVSRADPALIVKLFEMEVPEIYDGTVILKNAVREPGQRAKIAVYSREKDVDPVGACVGMKGSRVQSIIRELRNEKIDIVEWSQDPTAFAANALSPAKVSRVTVVDETQRILDVVVDNTQLSLAIGKKGQNVRLASKLVGWRIDIKTEEEKKKEIAEEISRMSRQETSIEEIDGLPGNLRNKLLQAGYATVGSVSKARAEDLLAIPGVGPKSVEKIKSQAQEFLSRRPPAVAEPEPEDSGAEEEPEESVSDEEEEDEVPAETDEQFDDDDDEE
jgi:N utilization substance protein A